jgi:hypothetical protein
VEIKEFPQAKEDADVEVQDQSSVDLTFCVKVLKRFTDAMRHK